MKRFAEAGCRKGKCEISRGRQLQTVRWIYARSVTSPRWKQSKHALCASICHHLDCARELFPFVHTPADLSDDVEIELDGIGSTNVDIRGPFSGRTAHFSFLSVDGRVLTKTG
jgi:hypothetical protein